jgi:hypothetical protein
LPDPASDCLSQLRLGVPTPGRHRHPHRSEHTRLLGIAVSSDQSSRQLAQQDSRESVLEDPWLSIGGQMRGPGCRRRQRRSARPPSVHTNDCAATAMHERTGNRARSRSSATTVTPQASGQTCFTTPWHPAGTRPRGARRRRSPARTRRSRFWRRAGLRATAVQHPFWWWRGARDWSSAFRRGAGA